MAPQLLISSEERNSTRPATLLLAPGKIREIQKEVFLSFGTKVHGVSVGIEGGEYFIEVAVRNPRDFPDSLSIKVLGGKKLRVHAVGGEPVKPWMQQQDGDIDGDQKVPLQGWS